MVFNFLHAKGGKLARCSVYGGKNDMRCFIQLSFPLGGICKVDVQSSMDDTGNTISIGEYSRKYGPMD